MRQEGQDCEKEKERASRPNLRRQLPPSKMKDTSASDVSLESPVDDSDEDANYKEESSKDESSESSGKSSGELSDDDLTGHAADKTKTAKKAKAKLK